MATILKSNQQASFSETKVFQFSEIEMQAEDCLAEAKQTAEEIIADAKDEAEQIREMTRQQTLAEAQSTAEQQISQQVDQQVTKVLPTLQTVIQEFQQLREDWPAHMEQQVCELATKMAACVIRRELQTVPQIPLSIIREALDLVSGAKSIQLSLHPDDHHFLRDSLQQLLMEMGCDQQVQLLSDVSITRGGCVVETQAGKIDQQMETRLARILEELA